MNKTSIIIRPLITEKGLKGNSSGKYVFLVNPTANKPEIKKVLEKLYGIKVAKISTTQVTSKTRMGGKGRIMAKRPQLKKATITVEGKKPLDVHKFSTKITN